MATSATSPGAYEWFTIFALGGLVNIRWGDYGRVANYLRGQSSRFDVSRSSVVRQNASSERLLNDSQDHNRRGVFSWTSARVAARQELMPLVMGVIGGTVAWSLLTTLHVLSGKMADAPGLWFGVLLGVVAMLARQRRLVLSTLAILAAAVLIVSLSPMMPVVATHWVREDSMGSSAVDAIVVLSGGLNPDTTIGNDALDRLLAGVELVNRRPASILVTTTTQEIFPAGVVSSEVDQSRVLSSLKQPVTWLRAWGGNSTRDEAKGVAALLHPRGLRRIVVVTSPIHTRRACAVFEAAGFVVFCAPARMRDASGLPAASTPMNHLVLFGEWIYEIAGMADYAIRGWLSAPTAAHSAVALRVLNMLNMRRG